MGKKKRGLLITLICLLFVAVCAVTWIGISQLKSFASSVISDSTTEEETIEVDITDESESVSSSIVITDVSDIVEDVMPAVVSITSRTLVNNYSDFWSFYFGESDETSEEVDSGIGSGTIVGTNDTELLILTSYHVVEDSSSLYVTFCDDEAVDGYIKSANEDSDIAVVAVLLENIEDSTLEAITTATICTEEADVGEGVIVIGNALGYGQSVTTGIVSAVNREITVDEKTITVLQTDAAINSGNSGGCVLNSAGQIIGISEAKISSDAVEGMCYAISVNAYAELIEELLTTTTENVDTEEDENESNSSQTAFLGIQGTDASIYGIDGVYVTAITSGGGAKEAGIEEGDIIVALNDQEITSMEELQEILCYYNPGDTVTLTLYRSTGLVYISMTADVTLTAQTA